MKWRRQCRQTLKVQYCKSVGTVSVYPCHKSYLIKKKKWLNLQLAGYTDNMMETPHPRQVRFYHLVLRALHVLWWFWQKSWLIPFLENHDLTEQWRIVLQYLPLLQKFIQAKLTRNSKRKKMYIMYVYVRKIWRKMEYYHWGSIFRRYFLSWKRRVETLYYSRL